MVTNYFIDQVVKYGGNQLKPQLMPTEGFRGLMHQLKFFHYGIGMRRLPGLN